MPEGHTIHRAARQQQRLLAGRRISVSSPQGRFAASAARVDGAALERVEAAGKHLFYHWDTGDVGHVHLGLFGKFRVRRGADPPDPIGAVRMRMATTEDDGGWVVVDLSGPTACTVDDPGVRAAIVERLGPDPLRPRSTPERMIDKVTRSRRAIADLLMDQSVIAGLGNVYRAELLFVHGMHPLRPGRACDEREVEELWTTAKRMLGDGLRSGRIVTVPRSESGVPAGRRIPRRDATYVYKRDRCIRCGDAIRTIEIVNRTCYFCPTDQPR